MGRLKKILLVISLIILTGFAALYFLAKVYEKDIKGYVVSEINKQLITQVDIADIDFTLIKHFPFATLEFKKVKIYNPKGFSQQSNLCNAESILLQFNILDIINKKYIIRKIKVEESTLSIIIDKKGNNNLKIFKKGNGESSAFKLSSVIINDLKLKLVNNLKETTLLADIDNAGFKGDFFENKFNMSCQAEGIIQELSRNQNNLLKAKKTEANIELKVNNNLYTILKGTLSLDDLNLNSSGTVEVVNDSIYNTNLTIEGENFGIAQTISFFPTNLQEKLRDYESDGSFYFNAKFTGPLSSSSNPEITSSFGIKNGSIKYKPTGTELHKVSLKGEFSKKNEKQLLKLSNVYAELNNGQIKGNLLIKDFDHPFIAITSTAKLDLKDIGGFMRSEKFEELKGLLRINVKFEGRVNNLSNFTYDDFSKANSSGNIELSQAGIQIKENPYPLNNISSSIDIIGNNIRVNEMEGKYGNTDFNLQGYFKNFLAYLFVEGEPLEIDATCQSDFLDLNEILSNKKEHEQNEPYILRFSDKYLLNLTCDIKKVSFRKFNAESLTGQVLYRNNELRAEDVKLSALHGSLNLNALLSAHNGGNFNVSCSGTSSNINIKELFIAMENIGQEVLQEKNISGITSNEFIIKGTWDSTITCKTELLSIKAHVLLDKGELKNFEPLYHLSKFISLDELKSIKFEKLENTIEIKNKVLFIPAMDISSNALNLNFYGTHTFDNVVDYHFKLLLNELLSKKASKAKKQNEEFGIIEDDGLGKTTLFIGMKGPVNDPNIYYDTQGLKGQTKQNIASEKQNIKSILKEELGLFKKDASIKDPEKKKEKELGVEWDEEKKIVKDEKKQPPQEKEKGKVNKLLKKQEKEETSGENSDDFN